MESGKFVLRMTPELHMSLKAEAREQGESLNSLCLKKLSALSKNSWSDSIAEIIEFYNPLGVVLFGSFARGESTTESDIDLLIVLDKDKTIERSLYHQWDNLKHLPKKASPQFVHLVSPDQTIGGIWLESALDGEIIYARNESLKKCLSNIRKQIAEGKYQRKASHGHPYWVNFLSEGNKVHHEE